MIEIIIAFDDLDVKLGDYFNSCKDDLLLTIRNTRIGTFSTNEMSSRNCNKAYLDIAFESFNDIAFIITAFMHGNEKQLIANNIVFIEAEKDNSFFQHSLFYTNSCLTGKYLGPDLISQNCRSFIGFDNEVFVLLKHQDIFIKCENFGMVAFIVNDITIFEAFERMQNNYTCEINKMKKTGDILTAGMLITAREALVFLGDKTLTKEKLL